MHGDAYGVDASDAFHGVGQDAGEFGFVRAGAAAIQRAQHVLDAGLVRGRIQRRHKPFLDRSKDPEIRSAGHAASLDRQIPTHVSVSLMASGRTLVERKPKMQLLRVFFEKYVIWPTILLVFRRRGQWSLTPAFWSHCIEQS